MRHSLAVFMLLRTTNSSAAHTCPYAARFVNGTTAAIAAATSASVAIAPGRSAVTSALIRIAPVEPSGDASTRLPATDVKHAPVVHEPTSVISPEPPPPI